MRRRPQVLKAYGGSKKIEWLEVLAGEKAFNKTGQWLPVETLVRQCGGSTHFLARLR